MDRRDIMKKSPVIGFALFLCLSLPLWAQEKGPSQSGGPITATGGGPSQCDTDPGDVFIDNCGFETGDFSGWTQSGILGDTYVDQACHLSGLYGACFTSEDLSFISQLIPTTPGESYDLRFGLRNHGQPNRFQVYWGGQLIYDQTDLPDFSTASDSLPGSEVFSRLFAASDVTELTFGFFNPTSGTFFLDDIWAWLTSRRPDVSCVVHGPVQDCPNLFDGVDVGAGGGRGQYAIQISYGSCAPCAHHNPMVRTPAI